MFDTHCHLTFPEFANRTAEILVQGRDSANLLGAITIATSTADALAARDLALAHPNLWHSAGIHPLYSDKPVNWDDLRTAASSSKCVAWGELGLDNHYSDPPAKTQRDVLHHQLAFIETAARINISFKKPVVVHCRDAYAELIPILASLCKNPDAVFSPDRFVFHCFTGNPADARLILDFGASISFTGIVTFANAKSIAEAAKLVPLDRMMVETDSPFLTPEPHRKIRPNEPRFVADVARFLADLRNIPYPDFEHTMDSNALRFFKISLPT
ncbi:MAG TPA: TatD family hydrolase [Phycisphaerales bacterium]|nr:TatD family hydrolase [Phycisphaerales bacterium]